VHVSCCPWSAQRSLAISAMQLAVSNNINLTSLHELADLICLDALLLLASLWLRGAWARQPGKHSLQAGSHPKRDDVNWWSASLLWSTSR